MFQVFNFQNIPQIEDPELTMMYGTDDDDHLSLLLTSDCFDIHSMIDISRCNDDHL